MTRQGAKKVGDQELLLGVPDLVGPLPCFVCMVQGLGSTREDMSHLYVHGFFGERSQSCFIDCTNVGLSACQATWLLV